MDVTLTTITWRVLFIPILGIIALMFFPIYRKRFTGTGWSWVAFPLTIIAAIGLGCLRAQQLGLFRITRYHYRHPYDSGEHGANEFWLVIASICAGLLLIFAVPFIMRMYNKWMGKSLTDAEKQSTVDGVRAWMCGSNLIIVVLISLCAWQGYFYSFWGVLAMMLGLLLVYPVFNMLSQTAPPVTLPPLPESADLSDEREKILELLEQGKITADEGSELLAALGASAPPPIIEQPAQGLVKTNGNGPKKIMLIGVLLVLIGFFLPWFSINLGREMTRMTNQMPQMTGMNMPNGNMGSFDRNAPMPPEVMARFQGGDVTGRSGRGYSWLAQKFRMPDQYVTGGEVGRGLGWIVLLIAGGVAFAPNLLPKVTPEKLKMISLIALGLGGIILLFIMTRQLRNVGVGIPLALAGYVLLFMGVAKNNTTPAPQQVPSAPPA